MRAAIFDLDGTLTDTLDLVIAAVNAALSPIWGQERSPEEVRRLFGPTEEGLIQRATEVGREAALARFFRYYEDEHDARASIFPGIADMLDRIAAGGLPIAVVTNKGSRSTQITLRRLGLTSYVAAVATGDDVVHPKPDPAGIFRVLEAMGANPDTAIYVGDSPSDMRAAQAAGVLAVGAGWSSASRLQGLADVMAHTPSDIPAILGTSGGSNSVARRDP